MNPSGNSPSFELPPIIDENPIVSPEKDGDSEEKIANPSERQPSASNAALPQLTDNVLNIPQAPIAIDDNSDDQHTSGAPISNINFAKDRDLIDKEWVNKAKYIVAKNKDDPFKQSAQLTLLKADYMKKRFNKTLKISK